MIKNNKKYLIKFVSYIFTFLVIISPFLAENKTYAADDGILEIFTGNKTVFKVGDSVDITATITKDETEGTNNLYFESTPKISSLQNCELDYSGGWLATNHTYSCVSRLTLSENGDFNISAYIKNTDGTIYKTSNVITIRAGVVIGKDPVATATETKYTLLAPLGTLKDFEANQTCPLGGYLNIMLGIFFGVCAVLAMVMIVMGGIEYMTSELISSKESGKESIRNALLGLLLALGAYLILNTLNPDLLKTCLDNVKEVKITINPGGESNASFVPIAKENLQKLGITCTQTGGASSIPTISSSFQNRSTYSMTKRNTYDESKKTAYFDCSSFVAQVYSCAGLSTPGNWTSEIFNSGETVNSMTATTVNGNYNLKTGDLLGWKQGGGEQYGHVVMYIGNGQVTEASSPEEQINQAIKPKSADYYKSRIKFIKKI